MKTKIILLAKLIIVLVVVNLLFVSAQKSKLVPLSLLVRNIEELVENESGSGECKWKNILCPWPGNKGYGVCIVNGDGVACSCGATTHDPLPC